LATGGSAEKAARQSVRRALRNKAVESATKTFIRKAEKLVQDKELVEAERAVLQAIRALDRAVRKGVIHPNNSARRKSRLMAKFNSAKMQASTN